MDDIILLKPAAQLLPQDAAPGELVLDQDGGFLLIDRGDTYSPEPIPLDVVPLPKLPYRPDPDLVAVMGAGGPEYALLDAGGGGRALDSGWIVPGVFASTFHTVPGHPTIVTYIDISEACRLVGLRVVTEVNLGLNVTFGIKDMSGATIVEFTKIATGIQEETCNVAILPGRYMSYVTPQNTMNVEVLTGVRAFASAEESFPVAIMVVVD